MTFLILVSAANLGRGLICWVVKPVTFRILVILIADSGSDPDPCKTWPGVNMLGVKPVTFLILGILIADSGSDPDPCKTQGVNMLGVKPVTFLILVILIADSG